MCLLTIGFIQKELKLRGGISKIAVYSISILIVAIVFGTMVLEMFTEYESIVDVSDLVWNWQNTWEGVVVINLILIVSLSGFLLLFRNRRSYLL